MQKNNAQYLSINLLKRQGNASWEVFIQWAITGGRFLVILTETIALAAFLYRFTLDRQLIDLHDKIKAKQAIVEALKPQEASFRSLQERLSEADRIDRSSSDVTTTLASIVEFASGRVSFTSLTVTSASVRMDITANSVTGLNEFISALRSYEPIKSVSIDRIENQTSRALFSALVSAHLKTGSPETLPLKQPIPIEQAR
jgi:Tfp pilus assembly protein PilN